jgi:thiol-disulfide isomerase/thioredoxin
VLPAVALQPVGQGAPARLDELSRPAVVNLWATWCVPCKKELPMLQAHHETVGDEVSFVGVNVGDDDASVAAFIRDVGVTYPQYLDPRGELSASLGIAAVPATFLVERDGSHTVHSGVLDERDLAVWIQEVTAEP